MKKTIRFLIVISLMFITINARAQTSPSCQGTDNSAWSRCTAPTLVFDNGNTYAGEWLNGKPNGQGTYTFKSTGDTYKGQFVDSKFNGTGVFTWSNGTQYVGQFANSYITGQGTKIWNTKHKYVGQFVNGYMEGTGTFTWPNGTKYVGQWQKSLGINGTYTYPNGATAVGTVDINGAFAATVQQAQAPQQQTQQAQAPQQQRAPQSNVASNYQTSSGLRKQINVLKYLDTRDEQNHLAYIAGIHGVFIAAMDYNAKKLTQALNQNKPIDTRYNRQTLKIGSLFSEVNAKRNWTEAQKQIYKQVMDRTQAVFLSENQMDDKAEAEIFDQCESLISQMKTGDEISAGRQAVNKFVENLDQVAEANRQKFLARTSGGQSVAELTCLVQGEDISPGKKFTINLTRVPVRVVKVPEEKGKLAIYIRGVDIAYEAKSWDSDYNYKLGNFNFNGLVTGRDLSTSNKYEIVNIGAGKGPLGDSTTALVIILDRKTGNLSVVSSYYEQKYGDNFLWDYPTAVKRFSGFCEKADTSTGNKF